MRRAIVLKSHSPTETLRIGRRLGSRLKNHDVVALEGALGAGKTTLAKGIAAHFGIARENVSSPTFVLIHEYAGKRKVYHMDWYRLRHVEGVDESLARECLSMPGICLVEWPERGKELLPRGHIRVELRHAGPTRRDVRIYPPAEREKEFMDLKWKSSRLIRPATG